MNKVFTGLLLLTCQLLFCQEKFLRHYSVAEGVPSTETYAVHQDSKGFIWVASDMGVARFDGYNFKSYTTANGLIDNTVFKFFEDGKGRIWFNTFSGRLCYYHNDSIYGDNIKVNAELRKFLGSGYVTGIDVDDYDTITLFTTVGSLKLPPVCINGIPNWENLEVLHSLKCYHIGNSKVQFSNTGRYKLDMERVNDRTGRKTETSIWHDVSNITTMAEMKDGSLMLFFHDSLCVIDSTGKLVFEFPIDFAEAVLEESDSTIWVGELRNGVQLLDKRNLSRPIKHLLAPLSVTGIFRDRENGYWFSTLQDGVFYLSSNAVTSFTTKEDTALSSEIAINVMTKDRIWAISNVTIYERRNNTPFTPILTNLLKEFTLPNRYNNVWNITSHSDGTFLVSTNCGIAVIDSSNYHIKKKIYLDIPEHFPANDSRKAIEDHEKNIWSLNHVSLTKIKYGTYEIGSTYKLPARAEAICEDYSGRILVGTVSGLFYVENDVVKSMGAINPIFNNRIVDIKKAGGCIAIATRGAGVILVDHDSIYQLTAAHGLVSNMCRSLFIDNRYEIWVATNNGLSSIKVSFKPFKKQVNSYTTADGLISNDVFQVQKDGKFIWLLTRMGICSFEPAALKRNDAPPPVYISGFKVDNVSHSFNGEQQIDYRVNFLSVDFVGLTFKHGGKQVYKYKLEGYDTSWNYTQNTNVQFTKLPPGDYRFIVSCLNHSGVESTMPAVLAFTVNSPFYKKWWFGLSLSLFSILVVMIISYLWVRRIREKERAKTEINRKIANLELHALRAQMNPHFIFNCLNAIQDFILKNDPESAKRYLTSFSKLIRKTLDNSRKQTIMLNDEISFLNLYLGLERMRFNDKFDYEIKVDGGIETDAIDIPAMILQPFVENAIRHSRITSMPVQGRLIISFAISDDELVCVIDDNGVGVKEGLKSREGDVPRTGLHAFEIISDRVKTINEVQQSNIRYSIVDKSDLNADEDGTRVQIFIPIKMLD